MFEGNVADLFKQAGIDELGYHFVSMLGTNPEYKGNGFGRTLLAWQIKEWRAQTSPGRGLGVVLDTTTERAIKIYQGLGFAVMGERHVETGTDKDGIKLSKEDVRYLEKKIEAEKICIQRVMKLDFT